MRPSERLRQLQGLTDKYRPIGEGPSLVKLRQPVGLPTNGRPLYRNHQDPSQFDNIRRAAITRAELRQQEVSEQRLVTLGSESAAVGPHTWKSLDDASLHVARLDKSVPGYRGFMPGRRSENVHRVTHGRAAHVCELL